MYELDSLKLSSSTHQFITQVEIDGSFCDMMRLDEELLEIRSGLPLSSDRACLIPPLDAIISGMSSDGFIAEMHEVHSIRCFHIG
jgi:hypothetical protein